MVQSWLNWCWKPGIWLQPFCLCAVALVLLCAPVPWRPCSVCHSWLTQHPQLCGREATATIPILLRTLASRRGPQKANWQLCFMSMPIEEWDSNHSFLLFLLAWSKYNWVWFTIKPFYCNQKHIYMAFCGEFSLYRCVGAASSVFQFKNFIFYLDLLSTWSCFK